MVLKLDPEMAAELKVHPEYTAPPPPPPEGVSLGAYFRALSNEALAPFGQSFVPRLPDGTCLPARTIRSGRFALS